VFVDVCAAILTPPVMCYDHTPTQGPDTSSPLAPQAGRLEFGPLSERAAKSNKQNQVSPLAPQAGRLAFDPLSQRAESNKQNQVPPFIASRNHHTSARSPSRPKPPTSGRCPVRRPAHAASPRPPARRTRIRPTNGISPRRSYTRADADSSARRTRLCFSRGQKSQSCESPRRRPS